MRQYEMVLAERGPSLKRRRPVHNNAELWLLSSLGWATEQEAAGRRAPRHMWPGSKKE
jgi:hypothetical protein